MSDTTKPLTEGMVRKGGQNSYPSQVVERPLPPAPMRPATTAITFQGMLLFDAIMNENGCEKRMCAYERNCGCWREWLVAVKEVPHAE